MAGNSIETLFDRTVDVNRLVDGEMQAHLTGVSCQIQPLEEGLSEDMDGNFGKDFLMFCDVIDIKEGDRVVDGSVQYHVTSVDEYNFLNLPRHNEVKIRLSND